MQKILKFPLFLALLLGVLLATSCDRSNIHQVISTLTETPADTTGFARKDLRMSPFAAVEVDCFADVSFFQTAPGELPRLVLMAPAEVLDNVIARASEGVLRVSINHRYRMPDKAVLVAKVYAPHVNRIEMNGGKCLRIASETVNCPVEITTNGLGAVLADSVKAPEIRVKANGAGSVRMKGIATSKLSVKSNGAGEVVLAGRCDSARVEINGAGLLDVRSLDVTSKSLQLESAGVGKVLR